MNSSREESSVHLSFGVLMGTEYPSSDIPIVGQSRVQGRVKEKMHLDEVRTLSRELIKEQYLLIEELSGTGRPFHASSDPQECVPAKFMVAQPINMVQESDLNTRPLRSMHSLGSLHWFNTRKLEIMRDLDANENASTGEKVPTWEYIVDDLEELVSRNQEGY